MVGLPRSPQRKHPRHSLQHLRSARPLRFPRVHQLSYCWWTATLGRLSLRIHCGSSPRDSYGLLPLSAETRTWDSRQDVNFRGQCRLYPGDTTTHKIRSSLLSPGPIYRAEKVPSNEAVCTGAFIKYGPRAWVSQPSDWSAEIGRLSPTGMHRDSRACILYERGTASGWLQPRRPK